MSAMWTPEEAGRLLANRVTQPHYVEAIVRKCIANALAGKEAETIERCAKVCDAAEELARRPSPAGQTSYAEGRRDGADCLAQAIRAMGKGS